MKSNALNAIQIVLDKDNKDMIGDFVNPSYYAQLKNGKRIKNRKALSMILNNQGIPYSFYEIICDFEEIINENIKDKEKAWQCLIEATLGILFYHLHDQAKYLLKDLFDLDLPDVDYEKEIKQEYESIKDPKEAIDFLRKAKEIFLGDSELKVNIGNVKKMEIPLNGEEILKALREVFSVLDFLINLEKESTEKIIIPATISENELRMLLNSNGLLYKSFIELYQFRLNYYYLFDDDNELLSHAMLGLFYEEMYAKEKDYIKNYFGIELPVIDFDLARKEEEEYLSKFKSNPTLT